MEATGGMINPFNSSSSKTAPRVWTIPLNVQNFLKNPLSLSLYLSIDLSIYPSIHLSIYPSISLSISIYLFSSSLPFLPSRIAWWAQWFGRNGLQISHGLRFHSFSAPNERVRDEILLFASHLCLYFSLKVPQAAVTENMKMWTRVSFDLNSHLKVTLFFMLTSNWIFIVMTSRIAYSMRRQN